MKSWHMFKPPYTSYMYIKIRSSQGNYLLQLVEREYSNGALTKQSLSSLSVHSMARYRKFSKHSSGQEYNNKGEIFKSYSSMQMYKNWKSMRKVYWLVTFTLKAGNWPSDALFSSLINSNDFSPNIPVGTGDLQNHRASWKTMIISQWGGSTSLKSLYRNTHAHTHACTYTPTQACTHAHTQAQTCTLTNLNKNAKKKKKVTLSYYWRPIANERLMDRLLLWKVSNNWSKAHHEEHLKLRADGNKRNNILEGTY